MFPAPDLATLRLCSILASAAYASIFLVLWTRRRGELYLLHWAASSALYALALLVFQAAGAAVAPFLSGLLCGLIAVTDMLLLTGVRLFEGKHAFRPWMVIPVACTALAVAVPASLGLAYHNAALLAAGRILGTLGLAASMSLAGGLMVFGARDGAALPRRIAGAALLAYLPSYIFSIVAEFWEPMRTDFFALLPMLSDQVLLGLLNLSLLAMPGERAQRMLRDSALRDALTGAWNRTALKHHDDELTLPANSVLLIDIDHFKSINDNFGHAAGDAVLTTFADRVEALARARHGRFVRLGGDEFLLVAPTLNDTDAWELAEQVRVEATLPTFNLPRLSVSIGLSRVHEGETSLSDAMARADHSLYRAKASGRNQVAA